MWVVGYECIILFQTFNTSASRVVPAAAAAPKNRAKKAESSRRSRLFQKTSQILENPPTGLIIS